MNTEEIIEKNIRHFAEVYHNLPNEDEITLIVYNEISRHIVSVGGNI